MKSFSPRRFLLRLWREYLRPLAVAAAIMLPMKSALADWNFVPSGSMEPSIRPGELVLVNKLAYDLKVPFTTRHLAEWGDAARGDVVVLFSPADETRLVKRVVGLPGDLVEMRDEKLWINGRPLSYAPAAAADLAGAEPSAIVATESLGVRPHAIKILPGRPAPRTFGPIRVPAGQYFVLGDNRDNSNDSRYLGCIDRARIVGRASAVIASVDLEKYGKPRLSRFLHPIP
jgi:signal peptidase I